MSVLLLAISIRLDQVVIKHVLEPLRDKLIKKFNELIKPRKPESMTRGFPLADDSSIPLKRRRIDVHRVGGVGEDGVGEDGVGEDGVGEDGVGEDGVGEDGVGGGGGGCCCCCCCCCCNLEYLGSPDN
ncbi:hypothetical protein V8F33_002663 [Rhypophila sp. PSN 637]